MLIALFSCISLLSIHDTNFLWERMVKWGDMVVLLCIRIRFDCLLDSLTYSLAGRQRRQRSCH